ncbi:thymidylate synthase [Lysinibacillus xylanilyticus]|uniref:thymidylate synthase n=1 Tax=Lysinibacillus xylanilyticus TaxID=582475 RepID=UPI0038163A1B
MTATYETADKQYNTIIKKILDNGVIDNPENVRTVYADGEKAPTKAIINVQMKFDNSIGAVVLTTKQVPLKDPIKELFWIWQKMSNKVFDLQQMGCTVWDEWELKDGTIGKAYGWQLSNKKQRIIADKTFLEMVRNGELSEKPDEAISDEEFEEIVGYCEEYIEYVDLNQVDYLLYMLKKNPHSRRIKTTLWCVEDLQYMALQPCVYETHWQLFDGKLALTVNIRSNDMALGNPYNIYQYSILHRMIAQVTGHEVGELCFNIDNAHIYDRHLHLIEEQIKGQTHELPTVWINPDVTSFYDFTLEDIKVKDYKHNGKFSYEIAI